MLRRRNIWSPREAAGPAAICLVTPAAGAGVWVFGVFLRKNVLRYAKGVGYDEGVVETATT